MFNKIVVPLDGSKLAECVFPFLIKMTSDCSVKDIILLKVCEPPVIASDYPSNLQKPWEKHVEELKNYSQMQCSLYLNDAEKQLNSSGIKNTRKETRYGDAAKEIVEFASQNEVDLIIMASHGRSGPSRWAFGSVTEKVSRSTTRPILIIRGPGCNSLN